MQAVTVNYDSGSVWTANTQALGLELSANGRLGASPLHTALADRWPVFVSDYRQRGRGGLFAPGDVWIWRDSTPWLIGLITRETPSGAARLRYIERALLNLSTLWIQEGLHDLALVLPGEAEDRAAVEELLARAFDSGPLRITVYRDESR